MKKLILLFTVIFAFALAGNAQVPGGCNAIYEVPAGQPYSTKVLRPPFFTLNRWECVTGGITLTEFEESPSNGMQPDWQLAVWMGSGLYYPIRYINTDNFDVYTFGVGVSQIDRGVYSVNQGTGVLSFDAFNIPTNGFQVYYELLAP